MNEKQQHETEDFLRYLQGFTGEPVDPNLQLEHDELSRQDNQPLYEAIAHAFGDPPTPSDPRLIRQLADDLEDHELQRLELDAEPFWMQDVRCAGREIERQRLAARAARQFIDEVLRAASEAGARPTSEDQTAD